MGGGRGEETIYGGVMMNLWEGEEFGGWQRSKMGRMGLMADGGAVADGLAEGAR
jgi:hypothetical protein